MTAPGQIAATWTCSARHNEQFCRRSYLHISKRVLEEETVEIDWSDKDAMRQLEDKWAMHSEWCHATLNDLLAAEHTVVATFTRGCHYAEVAPCSGDAEIDRTPEECNKSYIAIWRQFNDRISAFVTNSSHWDKDYMRKNRLWSHVGTTGGAKTVGSSHSR